MDDLTSEQEMELAVLRKEAEDDELKNQIIKVVLFILAGIVIILNLLFFEF